jgi:RNA polymerase sigma-70 factor (ECF subfamily)
MEGFLRRRSAVPAQDDFIEQAAPFRAELTAHCYRMLGSVQDAEVQETYVRGWRGYEAFEGRAALRTWLYRIATTACLRALESRARRVLPAGLGRRLRRPRSRYRRQLGPIPLGLSHYPTH